jgi:hypothetical protein
MEPKNLTPDDLSFKPTGCHGTDSRCAYVGV